MQSFFVVSVNFLTRQTMLRLSQNTKNTAQSLSLQKEKVYYLVYQTFQPDWKAVFMYIHTILLTVTDAQTENAFTWCGLRLVHSCLLRINFRGRVSVSSCGFVDTSYCPRPPPAKDTGGRRELCAVVEGYFVGQCKRIEGILCTIQ